MSTSEEYKGFMEITKDLAKGIPGYIKSAYAKSKPYVATSAKRTGKGMAKTGRVIKKIALNKPLLYTGANALAVAGISYLTDSLGSGDNGLDNNYYSLGAGLGTVGAFWAGLGVQYLRGAWPFIEVPENAYFPLQWFTGHKGRILEGPATRLFITPLERLVMDEEGLPVSITKLTRKKEMSVEFRTHDALQGTLNFQVTYKIPSKKDAKLYQWSIEKPIEDILDDRVKYVMTNVINSIEEMDGPRKAAVYEKDALEKIVEEMKSGKTEESAKLVDEILVKMTDKKSDYEKTEIEKKWDRRSVGDGATYLGEVIARLNNEDSKSVESVRKYGAAIVDISTGDPQYDAISAGILSKLKDAEMEREAIIQRAMGEAEAIIQRARGEREAAIITAEATEITTDKYEIMAEKIAGPGASNELKAEIKLRLAEMDNIERVGANGANVTIFHGAFPVMPAK